MIGKLALALVASLFAVPAIPQAPERPSTLIDSGFPPERYMGEAAAVVLFVNDPQAVCGHPADPRYVTLACASKEKGIMVLPNPCAEKFRQEMFARIACHEAGHINGWPRTHGG